MAAILIGLGEATRELAKLAVIGDQAGGNAVRAAGATIGAEMEARAPELSDELEGSIGRSVHMRHIDDNTAEVGTNHGLAPTFEYGGEITPTRKRVLASQEQGIVFGRLVTVPAQPFVRPAVDESIGDAADAAQRAAANTVLKRT